MKNKIEVFFADAEYRRFIRIAAALLVFFILFVHRAVDFVDVRYTMADDIDYSILSFAGIQGESAIDLAVKVAESQGRLGAVFGVPVVALMNTMASQVAYDAINMTMFFLAIASLAAILWHLYGLGFSLLFSVVFFALFPQLWDHAPPSASPVWFLMPILFFAFFYYFMVRFSITRSYLHYSLFFLFYLLSIIQYELFVVVFPVLALLLVWHLSRARKDPQRFRLIAGVAIVLATAIYFGTYFAYKYYFPGVYAGTSMGALAPLKIASTLYQLTIGAFSPYYLLNGQYEIFYFDLANATRFSLIPPFTILDIFVKTSAVDWLVALSSALIAVAGFHRLSTRIAWRSIFIVATLGVFIAISTMLLYAVSAGYQSLAASGTIFYVGSRYAYIGWVMALVALALLAAKAMPIGRVPLPMALLPHTGLAMLVLVGSVASSFLNERVADTMRINTSKWRAVAAALQCGPVVEALKNRLVVAPMLWNHAWYAHVRPDDYWRRYTSRYYDTPVAFRRDDDSAGSMNAAYFTYRMDQQGKVIAVMVASDPREGIATRLLTLTPRDAMIRFSFEGPAGRGEKHLCWGPGRVACGEFVLTSITNEPTRLDSVFFEKSRYTTIPCN